MGWGGLGWVGVGWGGLLPFVVLREWGCALKHFTGWFATQTGSCSLPLRSSNKCTCPAPPGKKLATSIVPCSQQFFRQNFVGGDSRERLFSHSVPPGSPFSVGLSPDQYGTHEPILLWLAPPLWARWARRATMGEMTNTRGVNPEPKWPTPKTKLPTRSKQQVVGTTICGKQQVFGTTM